MSTIQTQYGNGQDLADLLRAQKQQKEELESSHEREMDHLKQAYAAEKADLEDRFESGAQSDRLAHYDHLRNLKNQLTREEKNLVKLGNDAIRGKSDALKNEEVSVEKEGHARIDESKRKFAAIEEYERQRMTTAGNEIHNDHAKNTRLLMQESEKALDSLRETQEKFIADQKQMHGESLHEIEDHFNSLRDEQTLRLTDELSALEEATNRELNKKLLDTSTRLSRYESQKSDPFYQLQRFDSDLQETPDAYVLKVKVPDHERKNLRIQATGQDIQLIGIRTSDRELSADGRTLSSRSHQTISEKFNLSSPVDARAIQREEQGEFVQFTLPKFGPNHRMAGGPEQTQKRTVNDRALAQELRFGETLPEPKVSNAKATRGALG
jgi:HSP20 family molecular chaperone IbpA